MKNPKIIKAEVSRIRLFYHQQKISSLVSSRHLGTSNYLLPLKSHNQMRFISATRGYDGYLPVHSLSTSFLVFDLSLVGA